MATLDGTPGFAFAAHRSRRCGGDRRALPRRRLHARRASCRAAGRAAFADASRTLTCATTSIAFGHVLEGCRHARVAHLVYASSSSVYGANHTLPFSEDQRVDQPVSLYAATKCANELMAHSYAICSACRRRACASSPCTGRGDARTMAPMLFTRAILAGEPIDVFNHGRMQRDFTYVDDIVEGVVRTLALAARATRRLRRSTTSATARPCELDRIHRHAVERRSAARRSCASCRCSRATCAPPMRRSTACAR